MSFFSSVRVRWPVSFLTFLVAAMLFKAFGALGRVRWTVVLIAVIAGATLFIGGAVVGGSPIGIVRARSEVPLLRRSTRQMFPLVPPIDDKKKGVALGRPVVKGRAVVNVERRFDKSCATCSIFYSESQFPKGGSSCEIVAVHPFGLSGGGISVLAPYALAGGCGFTAVDLRGHGNSSWQNEPGELFGSADDVGRVLTQARARVGPEGRVGLLGASLGAYISLIAAGSRTMVPPDAIFLLNPILAPSASLQSSHQIVHFLASVVPFLSIRLTGDYPAVRGMVRDEFYQALHARDGRNIEYFPVRMIDAVTGITAGDFRMALSGVSEIRTTALIAGEDIFTDNKESVKTWETAQRHPRSTLTMVPTSQHATVFDSKANVEEGMSLYVAWIAKLRRKKETKWTEIQTNNR